MNAHDAVYLALALALDRIDRDAGLFVHGVRVSLAVAILLSGSLVHRAVCYGQWTGGLAPLPVAHVKKSKTRSGDCIYVATNDRLSWDAPLPATPDLDPQLSLRRPGDLGSGFVVGRKEQR